MDQIKGSELNLRNSFWSPDYITGIETFLQIVKIDKKCLSKELDFYRSVTLNCFTPFIDSLETVCNKEYKSNDSQPLSRTVLNQFWLRIKNSGISNITETCTVPLSTRLSQNKLYYNEIESELNEHYLAYQKTFKLTKESYVECEILAGNILRSLTHLQKNKKSEQSDSINNSFETTTTAITAQNTRSATNKTLQFQNIIYPFKLDNVLTFNNKYELNQFLFLIKSQLIYQKTFTSMLGSSNEYFKGSSLVAILKKINAKLDTSLYNLIRISQLLLSKQFFQEYYPIISGSYFNNIKLNFNMHRNTTESSPTFELESYYIWNSYAFENETSTETILSKIHESYSDLNKNTNIKFDSFVHRNISTSMALWFKKINKTVTDSNINNQLLTVKEINKKLVQLQEYQSKYFEQYKRLLYTRLQLEKTFFTHCTKYAEYRFKTNQLIQSVNQNFQTYINNISVPVNNLSENRIPTMVQFNKQSYSPIGFFNRDNSLPYTKWSINIDDISSYIILESMFSCTAITDDVINSISLIIKHVEKQIDSSNFDEEPIFDYWRSDLDIVRATNLEREFFTEFQNMTFNHDINTNTTRLIIEHYRNGSKFVLKDWIDLIKLFLLELPDSLIPMTLIDEVLKNENIKWLNMISTPKLRLIELIAIHLMKFGDIDSLFSLQNDIPFIQYFLRIRGINNDFNDRVIRLSSIVLDLFKNHLSGLSSLIKVKLTECQKLENVVPTIKVEDDQGNLSENEPVNESLLSPQKIIPKKELLYKHKRSISMTLLSPNFKTPNFENKNNFGEEDFIPIPFKTSSTKSSPSESLNKEKRKSGISLLYASQSEQH